MISTSTLLEEAATLLRLDSSAIAKSATGSKVNLPAPAVAKSKRWATERIPSQTKITSMYTSGN